MQTNKILKLFLIVILTLGLTVSQANNPVSKEREIACLTTAIYKEARGESPKGKAAIAQVVINRTKSPRFPDTICKVLKQPSQFPWFKNTTEVNKILKGDLRDLKPWDREAYQEAKQIALKAFYGVPEYNLKLENALYFVNRKHDYIEWTKKLQKVQLIGQHTFYSERKSNL